MKVINREWDLIAAENGNSITNALDKDKVLRNATRFALKLGEHTWGGDKKRNLFDDYSWKNVDFEKARAKGSKNSSQYLNLESTWWEQRQWGVTILMETLLANQHPLAKKLIKGFNDLQPKTPDLSSLTKLNINEVVKPSKIFQCNVENNNVVFGFDKYGRISHLVEGNNIWADENNTLLQLRYRSYSLKDVNEFMDSYVKLNATWTAQDYGKPGLPSDVEGKFWETNLSQFYVNADDECSFAMKLNFEKEAFESYGAPEFVWISISLSNRNDDSSSSSSNIFDVAIGMFNKTRTRLPESMFVRFEPFGRLIEDNNVIDWEASRIGEWVGIDNIVDGGSKHLYGVTDNGIRATNMKTNRVMSIFSFDSTVATFGKDTAYPSPTHVNPDVNDFGTSFVLWDNLWGTNYILWWPFEKPPKEYMDSATYFPDNWTTDFISRYQISFND